MYLLKLIERKGDKYMTLEESVKYIALRVSVEEVKKVDINNLITEKTA